MIKFALIVLIAVGLFTWLSVWAVPILWVQGSSAAFNFGILLCVLTIGAWWGGYTLIKMAYNEDS